jgi:glycosyltransferase involved in cell wall biosynthesis
LDQAVKESGVADRIKFVGYVKNPANYLRAADIVLVCSRAEAFGRATVEGMLAGKPVIGTDSGGTPELIDAGRTGSLYPPGNAEKLAERIGELANDPAKRVAMGQAAATYAQMAFSPERYTDQLMAVLNHAVSGEAAEMSSALTTSTGEGT